MKVGSHGASMDAPSRRKSGPNAKANAWSWKKNATAQARVRLRDRPPRRGDDEVGEAKERSRG
jgi:hypothetical protein